MLVVLGLVLAPEAMRAQPAPLVLDNDASARTPLPHLEVLIDTTGALTFEQVRQPPVADRFQPAPDGIPRAGGTSATRWARFTVRRPSIAPATWWMELWADSVTVFLPQPDEPPTVRRTGLKIPVAERSVARGSPIAVRMSFAPGTDQPVYLRIRNDDEAYRSANGPIVPSVQPAPRARSLLVSRDYFQGAFLGVMLALGLYNLFLFVTVRSRPYLYYVLITFFWALFWVTALGYHLDLGWPVTAPGAYAINFFVLLGIPIFHVLFTQTFLDTQELVPRLHHVLTAILVGCLGAGLLGIGGLWDVAEVTAASLSLLFAPLVIGISVLVYRRGYTPARYYLGACAMLAVGVVVYTLRWFGVLPDTVVTRYSVQLGVVLEALLFSLALADRIRLLERERKQALDQKNRAEALTRALRETNDLKTQLLGLAAHDLRSPLTNILGYADMLGDRWPDAVPRAPLRAIHNAAERMDTLLNDLLNTTAIESGEIAFSPRPVDFARITEGIVNAYRPQAANKQQTLTLDLPPSTIVVHGDEERLREAIDNLISNAIKFTHPGGSIQVAVRRTDPHARLYVRDDGPGLSEEDQRHLFERFKRLSTRPTANEPSTGLGLAITKHIIDLHDGRIWAESTPGDGTTFVIELDLLHAAVGTSS